MRFDRPGCFGFATTYNAKSKVCEQCSFATDCSAKAKAALDVLADKLNVGAIEATLHGRQAATRRVPVESRPALPSVAQRALARMPKHAAKVAEGLLRSGINFRRYLAEGTNPLSAGKPPTMAVLFDLLLKGEVSRKQYMEALQCRLGHSAQTASSQASIGCSVAMGLGIAVRTEAGGIMLRR